MSEKKYKTCRTCKYFHWEYLTNTSDRQLRLGRCHRYPENNKGRGSYDLIETEWCGEWAYNTSSRNAYPEEID